MRLLGEIRRRSGRKLKIMELEGIRFKVKPMIQSPICIAGFDGWGNALDVSRGLTSHLVRTLSMKPFAELVPDFFYRYDDSRPDVRIEDGVLNSLSMPGGQFFEGRVAQGPDLLILTADEPTLGWRRFAGDVLGLIHSLGGRMLITIGSMYDQVLPSDRMVSAVTSDPSILERLGRYPVSPLSYTGPSAVHGVLQAMGPKMGITCISLWAHCPYYVHGVKHYGLFSYLTRMIGAIAGFPVDTSELEEKWKVVAGQIQEAAADSPKLQEIMDGLQQSRKRGSLEAVRTKVDISGKVVDLREFFNAKEP